jgi:hypothetical protein
LRELFSFIFDRITDPLGLPIEPWKEWIILLIIGAAAFRIAFRSVGDMYNSGAISGGFAGSFFHWLIRAVVFVAIWAVTYAVIETARFVAAHWIVLLATATGMLICGAIGFIVYRRMKGGTQNA